MWALGVTAYRMMAGKVPYLCKSQIDYKEAIEANNREALPTKYSQQLRDLVDQLLTPVAAERPTIEYVLNHPLII